MENINEEHTTNVKQKRQREAKLRNKEQSSIIERIVLNTFEITEEDIGINLKKNFNIFSQKNVVNVLLVKRKFVTISMKMSKLNN